jgi:excisionase family DNA binding protein
MTEERLSLRDAADQLGVSEVTARRWIKTGKLQAYKPGLKYLIPTSAVEGLLKSTDASKKEASLRATSREIYATWPEERRKKFWYAEQTKLQHYESLWCEQSERPEDQDAYWCTTVQLIALGWNKLLSDFGRLEKEECTFWEWYAFQCFLIDWRDMNDAADLVEQVAKEQSQQDEETARARRNYAERLRKTFPAQGGHQTA